MCEHGFVRLAVPQTSAGQISAVRRVNHGGTFPIPERAPAQVRDIGHELVEPWINEIDELEFEHGTATVSGESACDAKNGRFCQRRIKNLLGKFGRKFLGEPKYAAFWIFDVFAENDAARIFFEAETQSLVHGVADPIFARGQNLLVDLRQRAGDICFEFVRRRIFSFFSFGVFAANSLFDFVVDLREFFGLKHALSDQFFLPAFDWIAFLDFRQLRRASIKFLIVGTGVTGKPFHRNPPKMRTAASAHFFYCAGGGIVNLLNVFAG